MGELFHSTDGGATWTYPPLSQITAGYRSPVQFTGKPNVLWAIDAGSDYPCESTDGGKTWSDASNWNYSMGYATFLYTDATLASNFIVCSTSTGSGTNNCVYLSTDGGATWGSPVYEGSPGNNSSGEPLQLVVSGLFKSGNNVWISTSEGILYSSDCGSSFGMLTVPWNSSTEAPSSVAISQAGNTVRFVATTVDPAALYAGDVFEWSGSAQNVYLSDFNVSTNTQGAWTNITSRLPANELEGFAAMAQGNINTIYLAGANETIPSDYDPPSVLKSTDGGLTWNETFQYVNNANIATNQFGYWGSDYNYSWAGYAMSLQVCSNNVNQLVISDMGTAWMTTDGGAGGANTTASNADWKDITVAPQDLHDPGTVAAAGTTSYAGSADNTATYTLTYLSPNDIFAAMTDQTGMYSTNGGASWYYPTFNSGAHFSNFFNVTEDYGASVLFAAAGNQNDLFKDWRLGNWNRDGRGGGLDYSTDGGKTWSLLHEWTNADGSTNPVTEVVIDPNVAGRAYALVANSTNGGIWVTNNLYLSDGKTVNPNAIWTALAVPSRSLGAFTYGFSSQQYAAGTYYAHDPNDLKVLNDGTLVAVFDEQYDATGSYMTPCSGVWTSTDGGNTWTDCTDANLTQSNMMFYAQKICIDPLDPTQNTWYVATDFTWQNYMQDNYGVFMTTNCGATWTQIFTGDTPDQVGLGCDNVTVNPYTGEMYVSTDTNGVYYSATDSNFKNLTQEPYTDVDDVVIDPYGTGQVWACTHGNGMQTGYSTTASPSDLTLVTSSDHQFALSWTAIAGATGYEVQYTTGSVNWTGSVTWKTYSSLPAGSSSTNIDGLAGDSNYDFRVVPLNGLTAIASSNIVSGTIPGAATGLSAVASGPSEVELEWGGDQQYNSGYCLQYSTDGVTWQNLTTITSPTSTNYSASGLQPDTQYSFRITAFSATGESAPSNVAVARTLLASRLLAYEGFNYLPDPTNDNQLLGTDGGFGWSGGWGYYGAADGTREVISGSLVASNALVADNLLTTGNTFEADNFGAVSRSLASTTPSAPGTILWLSFLVKTYNVVPVGYVQLVDATGGPNSLSIGFACQYDYSIVIGNTNYWSTGTAPAVDTTHFLVMEISYNASPTTDNVQMWIDPNPAAGSPGTPAIDENTSVALPAFNRINIMAGWYGGYENDWDEIRLGTSYAAVAPTKVPLSPTGLTATPGTGQIDLAWTDSASNTTGYDVQRSTDQINWSTPTDGLLGPDATSYTDSSVTVGTTYYYRVYATGASGNSIDSNTADTMPAVAWSGGGANTNWSTAANWSAALTAGDPLVFSGTEGLNSTNDLPASTEFNGITFPAGTSSFVLSGNAVGLDGEITDNSANTQTIELPLTLVDGNQTLDATAGDLTISGDIGQNGGSYGLTKTGAGAVTLSGTNTYTGGTMVLGGVLVVTSANAIAPSSALIVGSGGESLFAGISAQIMQAAAPVSAATIVTISVCPEEGAAASSVSADESSVVPLSSGSDPVVATSDPVAATTEQPDPGLQVSRTGYLEKNTPMFGPVVPYSAAPPSPEGQISPSPQILAGGIRPARAKGKTPTEDGTTTHAGGPSTGSVSSVPAAAWAVLGEQAFANWPEYAPISLTDAYVDLVLSRWKS